MLQYALNEGLNNRVMTRVKKTMEQLVWRMRGQHKIKRGQPASGAQEAECMGRCLCRAFYDQVCFRACRFCCCVFVCSLRRPSVFARACLCMSVRDWEAGRGRVPGSLL